ncbi:hypothetical protein [Rhizobium leguminosarum]|uniref:hypothetical protein n=1 Tax=Rhizobium leguminosarum TaxID=384 RepID=UPI001C96E847|nr:hypothetical protein [Rhizobium leguminosarum]MBY5751418.1 hypothetical protein [Rhizobium leguminosarum]
MKATKITAIDFFDDLSSPYARKRFFVGFIVFGGLCIVAMYLDHQFVPNGAIKAVLDSVLANLLSSILVILGFYILYTFFIGPNDGLKEVVPTRARDISEAMKQLPEKTRSYLFWGRSGSYFRSSPLIVLDGYARRSKIMTNVDVLMPDPFDERLINSYRDIKDSLGEESDGNPLLANVLATTICCAVLNANNRYLSVRVFYSAFLPAFRVDLSDNGSILTQDDKSKGALFFKPSSEFHELLRTSILNEMAVSREINLEEATFKKKKLDSGSCTPEILARFGVAEAARSALAPKIATLIEERRHRYT